VLFRVAEMDKKLSREHKRNGELNDLKKQLEASLKAKQKEIRLYVLLLTYCVRDCEGWIALHCIVCE
jgi:hypothetical protein